MMSVRGRAWDQDLMLVNKGAMSYLYILMERKGAARAINYNNHRAAGCGPAWEGGLGRHKVSIKNFPV